MVVNFSENWTYIYNVTRKSVLKIVKNWWFIQITKLYKIIHALKNIWICWQDISNWNRYSLWIQICTTQYELVQVLEQSAKYIDKVNLQFYLIAKQKPSLLKLIEYGLTPTACFSADSTHEVSETGNKKMKWGKLNLSHTYSKGANNSTMEKRKKLNEQTFGSKFSRGYSGYYFWNRHSSQETYIFLKFCKPRNEWHILIYKFTSAKRVKNKDYYSCVASKLLLL